MSATVTTLLERFALDARRTGYPDDEDPRYSDWLDKWGDAIIAAAQADRLAALVEALLALDTDNHYFSKRPCKTCERVTSALGEPFGCVRYARTGSPWREHVALRQQASGS